MAFAESRYIASQGDAANSSNATDYDAADNARCLCHFSLVPELFPDQFANGVKCSRIMNRNLGKRFAVKRDVCRFQTMHELAVTQSPHFDGGTDACDPKTPKIAFANPAVSRCISVRANNGFLDGTKQSATTATKPFGTLEQPVFAPATCRS